jgi:hypothetical protein
MRLAVFCKDTANGYYRGILPMSALERLGHHVTWPGAPAFVQLEQRLPNWQLLHLHQLLQHDAVDQIDRLQRNGIAVVWDTDDDLSAVPKSSPGYRRLGGKRGIKRHFAESVQIAKMVNLLTTPSAHLADVYRNEGVERVAVIGNYLTSGDVSVARTRHAGIVIGCTAAVEHSIDLEKLKIGKALQRVLDENEGVRVIALGVDLGVRHHRYTRHLGVQINELIRFESIFDIGIAPLIDSPLNRSRSDIKIKEYAAAGAMWLASPRGPYVGLGEAEGGQLVGDDEWYDVLSTFVCNAERRLELTKRARAWAKRNTIETHVKEWENAFRGAIIHAKALAS